MKIWDKILSGRFILTVICGLVFAYCSIKRILPVDGIKEIVLIVIYGYFTRHDRKTEDNGKEKPNA